MFLKALKAVEAAEALKAIIANNTKVHELI
jgi:hypothetical protein